jgi:large subunit ribosomal protein L27
MAHVKAGGTAKGNKDSVSKRLGVKVYGGQVAKSGSVIVRQRGSEFLPATGAEMGKDFTIFATTAGIVNFITKRGKRYVSVLPDQRLT